MILKENNVLLRLNILKFQNFWKFFYYIWENTIDGFTDNIVGNLDHEVI
jgi:hypothetical protein